MSINLLEMFSSMYVPKVVIHSLIANLGNTLPAYVIGCWFYFASKSRKEENHQIVFLRIKYVGVQSWKAAHLPTLEIRVEQKREPSQKREKNGGNRKNKSMVPRPGIEPGTRR